MSRTFTIIHMNINTVRPQDNKFTSQLTHIVKPPDILYYCGTLPTERTKSVAIVGSRKPTSYGRSVTEAIVRDLAKHNVIIISGLALGIDSIAHQAALRHDTPTIAVMARGLDKIYPASHHNLAQNIIKSGGALISTYEVGIQARPYHFLERNRLVSGLADIVIITEAAVRSGTLNTAMHALDQGKDIFVVPGNITSPMSAGCNRLLRQGAQPLIDTSDILEALGISPGTPPPDHIKRSDPLEQAILDSITEGANTTSSLIARLDQDHSKIFSTLSILEIGGVISSAQTGKWIICP